MPAPPHSAASRLVPLGIAITLAIVFAVLANALQRPPFEDFVNLPNGAVSDAQSHALDMVKELNTYLVSTTTLLLGGLGWYLSHYRPPKSTSVHAAFFSSVAFLTLAYIYAGLTNVELTGELAQNSLALKPGSSLILYYLEMEIWTCGIASLLMVLVFTDAVTKGKL